MPPRIGIATAWLVVTTLILASCTSTSPSALSEVRDLEYQPGRMLDVYAPDGDGPKPVAIMLHGAGLDRRSYEPFARKMAAGGAVVFNIDWNVLEARVGIQEVACALRFAAEPSSNWTADPDRITLVAHSSAFAVAGSVAMTEDFDLPECTHDAGAAPVGLVGISPFSPVGGEVWPRTLLGTNPELRIRLIEGNDDPVVRPGTSQRTVDILKAAGYQTDLLFVNGGHFDIVLVDIEGPPPPDASDDTVQATLEVVVGGARG